MKKYFVNIRPQANGDYEVHIENCNFLPSEFNRKYLGTFASCEEAVKEAKKYYPNSNGCFYCSRLCHTS